MTQIEIAHMLRIIKNYADEGKSDPLIALKTISTVAHQGLVQLDGTIRLNTY